MMPTMIAIFQAIQASTMPMPQHMKNVVATLEQLYTIAVMLFISSRKIAPPIKSPSNTMSASIFALPFCDWVCMGGGFEKNIPSLHEPACRSGHRLIAEKYSKNDIKY